MATPTETIVTAITDPASASSDGQSVSSRSASDLIMLLNYAATLATIGNRRRGIRYNKMTNPGTIDACGAFYVDDRFNGGGFYPG